jgi:hypothetical protein
MCPANLSWIINFWYVESSLPSRIQEDSSCHPQIVMGIHTSWGWAGNQDNWHWVIKPVIAAAAKEIKLNWGPKRPGCTGLKTNTCRWQVTDTLKHNSWDLVRKTKEYKCKIKLIQNYSMQFKIWGTGNHKIIAWTVTQASLHKRCSYMELLRVAWASHCAEWQEHHSSREWGYKENKPT